MASNANDMFQKVSRSTATTLSAPGYTIGATSINVASTSNWPADTGITFGIDEVDGNGDRINGTYNIFRGTVGSATQLANLTYVGGDANRNYSAGATTRVYILVSYARENRLVDGLLVSHNQDGTLKTDSVDSTQIKADAITTPKLASGSVTADKRSGGFYIGTINISSGTGNQSFTGVGFKPKLVKFTWSNQSTGTIAKAYGHMTDNGQYATSESYDASNRAYQVSVTRCFITTNTVGTWSRTYEYVSMDSDGFTINKVTNTGTPTLIVECYA